MSRRAKRGSRTPDRLAASAYVAPSPESADLFPHAGSESRMYFGAHPEDSYPYRMHPEDSYPYRIPPYAPAAEHSREIR
jgi:hypothetical protein